MIEVDAEVLVERGRARRRLIPDVDAGAAWNAGRDLNRWIADDDIASDSGIRGRRDDDDAIRVAVGGVLLDEVVVAAEDADAEIVIGSREAVSRRLVPPERVIAAQDSYAAAGQSRLRAAVPDGDIRSERDLGRVGLIPNARLAVGRRRHALDLAEQRSGEEDAIRPKPLDDAWTSNLDVALTARADARARSP